MKRLLLTVLCGILPAFADSITTTDNLSIFGTVNQLDQQGAKLTGRFRTASGTEERVIEIAHSRIVKIEFNKTTFNSGGPPSLGAHPGKERSGSAPSELSQDSVVLRGGQIKPCDGATVDSEKVHCGKQVLDRSLVIRILFGGK